MVYCANLLCVDISCVYLLEFLPMKTKQAKNFDPKKSNSIKIVSRNIRYYRLQMDISQEYLAELSNTHRNFIGLLERCETNINLIHLEKIAKALKISVPELVSKHDYIQYNK